MIANNGNSYDRNLTELKRYLGKANIKEFWAKTGHGTFYKVSVTDDDLVVRKTRLNFSVELGDSDRSKSRSWDIDTIKNGYEYLYNETLSKDGGAFFGCSDGDALFPLKEYQKYSTQVVTEIDNLTKDEQLAKYNNFAEVTGLNPYLISSGSKSVHGHLLVDERTDIERIIYLRRLFCIAVDGDPAVARHHQPFRLPTFYRKEKGNFQVILREGESYSYERLLGGFRAYFKYLGYKFPESIGEAFWSHLQRILKSDSDNKASKSLPISKEEKLNNLGLALNNGEKAYLESLKKTQKQRVIKSANYKFELNIPQNELEVYVRNLFEYIPSKSLDDGLYDDYRSCYCACKNLLGETAAIAIANNHSNYKDWSQVIKSSHGNFGLGTIIYYAKLWGGYVHRVTSENLDQFSSWQQWLIKEANNLSKGFKKGFKEIVCHVPELKPVVINYEPNMVLPSPNDYDDRVIPEFIVPRKYRKDKASLKVKLISLGWVLHDNSLTGDGKSDDVVKMGNILYLDTNYKNPSIKDIEKIPSMPSRTQYGLFDVDGKIKADPPEDIRRVSDKVASANCHLKPAFRVLEDKGFDVDGTNAICGKCPNQKSCHIVSEDNVSYGFKGERRNAIAKFKNSGQGRAHYKQIQPEMLLGDNAVYKDFIPVIEEAGVISMTKKVTAKVENIDKAIARITRINSVGNEFRKDIIIDFLNKLRDVIENAYNLNKTVKGGKFYGLNKQFILNQLSIPELTENEIFILQNEFDLDIDKVIPDYVGIDRNGLNKDEKRQARNAERVMKDEQYQQLKANLDGIDNNWFSLFLNVLFGYQKGTFLVNGNNELEVITVDDHHQKLAKNAKGLLLLDATKSTKQLKAIYAIDKPMMTFKVELPSLSNLKVYNVNMSGLSSNNWSDNLLERMNYLVSDLKDKHDDNIAFISPKKYTKEVGTNYYFGRDDRGSNELMKYEAIAHLGKPMPNLGEAQITYDLFIDIQDYSFEDYFSDLIREAQLQGLGRSRAQHSPNKIFTHYFMGTNQNLSFLESYGVKVINTSILDISPNAASKGDKTRHSIVEYAKAIVTNGQKLTQEAIAKVANISQQLVSKAFKGSSLSWYDFQKLLLNLYSEYKEKVVKNHTHEDLLEMWLNDGISDILEIATEKIINNGVDGLIEVAQNLNASLHSLYRLLWLIAPIFDKRLENLRDLIAENS